MTPREFALRTLVDILVPALLLVVFVFAPSTALVLVMVALLAVRSAVGADGG